MRSASRKEILYLNSVDGKAAHDASLINEMSRRLDALRRFDQFCCSDGSRAGRPSPRGEKHRKSAG
jgi:hypothetical protein